jgi:hypothetical protein
MPDLLWCNQVSAGQRALVHLAEPDAGVAAIVETVGRLSLDADYAMEPPC